MATHPHIRPGLRLGRYRVWRALHARRPVAGCGSVRRKWAFSSISVQFLEKFLDAANLHGLSAVGGFQGRDRLGVGALQPNAFQSQTDVRQDEARVAVVQRPGNVVAIDTQAAVRTPLKSERDNCPSEQLSRPRVESVGRPRKPPAHPPRQFRILPDVVRPLADLCHHTRQDLGR
jgi:hypothetical protein